MSRFTWMSSAVLATVAGCGSSQTNSPDAAPDHAEQLAGLWHYDLPDLETGRNVATLRCPVPGGGERRMTLPQIGSLALRRTAPDRLEGTTDQGCTWLFEVTGNTAELSPAGQSCHNQVFDLSYTIDRWTFTQDGERGSERLTATSHNPGGDCAFELADGSRSRVPAGGGDLAAPLAGTWIHAAPDPISGLNVAQVVCPAEGAPPVVSYEPVIGAITLTRTGDTSLDAEDASGCSFTLDVQGGMAALSPAPQTCARPDGTSLRLSFWTFAIESGRAFEILSATRKQATDTCAYVLAAGTLVRP